MLHASESVSHSFNFVFDRIHSVMASADDNDAQLPADPGFLTPPSRVVTRGAFRGIPCREGLARLVSRYELIKLVEHGRAPHSVHNPAQPGRITARNATSDEESGKYYFKFPLNVFGFYLLLRSKADCRRRNVQAQLMMRRSLLAAQAFGNVLCHNNFSCCARCKLERFEPDGARTTTKVVVA